MEAPKEIYLNYYGESAMWNERIESCDKTVKYIRADKAIDKDVLLEYLQKEYETNKWFYETHAKPNELHTGRCEAYKRVINKIESL